MSVFIFISLGQEQQCPDSEKNHRSQLLHDTIAGISTIVDDPYSMLYTFHNLI